MNRKMPSVYTIAPGSGFLHVLSDKILDGFPLNTTVHSPSLSSWTILVPTRRAARELATIFTNKVKTRAILLPRIRPIGDMDENSALDDIGRGDLPKALPRSGQLLILFDLLAQWARENPQIALAQEIKNSAVQSLNLASSLLQLLDQVETEETSFDRLPEAYDADLSEHRGAILSLINILKVDFQRKLHDENVLSPAAYRSRLIRLEAQRIERHETSGPLIAAGSTGTIPATRALLKAIASHPQGAVVLPGLDHIIDDDTWSAITPEHAQFSLKTLLAELELTRDQVEELGQKNNPRNWLSSELMRPSATADQWHVTLNDGNERFNEALKGLSLIEAPDRHSEARTIALILREVLEHEGRSGALITPDRDLARRVRAELRRWNVEIDDSAGDSLVKFGLASCILAIIHAAETEFRSETLLALLTHINCDFGMGRDAYLTTLRHFELAVLRGYSDSVGIDGIKIALERAQENRRRKIRVHELIANLSDDDWHNIHKLALQIIAVLKPVAMSDVAPLNIHIEKLANCLSSLAPNADWSLPENRRIAEILDDLKSQSHRLDDVSFSVASSIISLSIRNETLRTTHSSHTRLAIYGVLEARLVPVDVMVLGGLNEGKWPAQTDPGPWLNRSMRSIFEMQQPERDIGVSAHDFTQAFGHRKLFLTWAKRIEGTPQIPSRWVLRLQTVLQIGNVATESFMNLRWLELAELIDRPVEVSPQPKPKPKPPVSARPLNFSVSAVEKLIRDPYSVYASKILNLEPLQPLAKQADASLRGIMFHAAIDQWNGQQSKSLLDNSLELLLAEGRKCFELFNSDPEAKFFWWPRFLRMAKWLATSETERRANTSSVIAEIEGRISFKIGELSHSLYARADRIDILSNGQARIIDYKSGAPPTNPQMISGMKPQLPLEAAILFEGGFVNLAKMETEELLVLQVGGAKEVGKEIFVEPDGQSPTELGLSHLAAFKRLLLHYRNPNQAYYPRANLFKEDDSTDYDHLSRYAEWILAGET